MADQHPDTAGQMSTKTKEYIAYVSGIAKESLAGIPQHPVAKESKRAVARGQRAVERVRGLRTKLPLTPQGCARHIPGSARSQKDYRLNT